MTRLRGALPLLAALALAACAATAPQIVATTPQIVRPATPPPRAERPTYTLGEKWIRNDGVYELTRIDDERYVFTSERGRRIQLSKDLVPVVWGRGYDEWYFDTPPALSWPLEVGRRGEVSGAWHFFEWRPPWWYQQRVQPRGFAEGYTGPGFFGQAGPGREWGGSLLFASFAWAVEAYEQIRVPAGTFAAFRLRFTLTRYGTTTPQWAVRVWYAPAVRQLVKAEGRNAGLLAFEVVATEQPVPAPVYLTLFGPKDQARVAAEEIVLTGQATAGRGVGRVTVTLNGEVGSEAERQLAVKVAEDVEGVKEVVNRIQLRG